jgi:hypothetical protein
LTTLGKKLPSGSLKCSPTAALFSASGTIRRHIGRFSYPTAAIEQRYQLLYVPGTALRTFHFVFVGIGNHQIKLLATIFTLEIKNWHYGSPQQ